MRSHEPSQRLRIFTTCPMSSTDEQSACVRRIENVARWSEDAGCEGILVFSDNRQLDVWLVAQVIINGTKNLSPLVAVQPAYMHPYAVAKMIATFAFMHGRRVYLNMVAGGFKNDLLALDDPTPHDERYNRLIEYTTVITRLCTESRVSFEGRYYRVKNLSLMPRIPPALVPGVLNSGSSEAGQAAARELSSIAIEYPKPSAEYGGESSASDLSRGIRIGLITRETHADAWAVAHARFPEDRKGQLAHKLAMQVSDSAWHKQLSDRDPAESDRDPYWLVPFQNYKAMCPYLVGSYECVASEIARYVNSGYRTFILDEPVSALEMQHVAAAFDRAQRRSAAA